jgi:hypothetical protein
VQFAITAERGVAPGTVHRDANQFRAEAFELRENFVVERHLIAANGAPIGRIKGEHDGLATKLAQLHRLIGSAVKTEVRRRCTGRQSRSAMIKLS